MKTLCNLRATIQDKVSRLMSVLMIAALLATGALLAQPVGKVLAATCTATDGDWMTTTWSCGHVPDPTDDVTILATSSTGVTLADNVEVNNLTIDASGILSFNAAVTLTIHGNFNVAATGVFDPGSSGAGTGGTVEFAAGSQTITTNGQVLEFWDLTKTASVSGDTLSVDPPVSGTGGILINDVLTLNGTAPSTFLLLRSTVDGTQWNIDPLGTRNVDYVDVKDSDNVSGTDISVANGTDSGNNTGWAFSGTQVVLTSSNNPSKQGESVTFTATITPNSAAGTVDFQDGGTSISGCDVQPVSGGVATCTTSALAGGSHTITAVYSGDGTNPGKASTPITQFVKETLVVLTSSKNPSKEWESVTFTATITPSSATGTVNFRDGGTSISGCDDEPVSGGVATCTTSALTGGSHTITADYSGDLTNPGKTSGPLTQVVNVAQVVLASSKNPSLVGKSVTFTATIAPSSATGTVDFQDGGVSISGCDAQPISGGVATCTTSGLAIGSHTITAVYSGDVDYPGKTSDPIIQVVNALIYYLPLIFR